MNYSLYLSQFLTSRIEEHEEDFSAVKCNIVNPFNEDKQEFSQLSLKVGHYLSYMIVPRIRSLKNFKKVLSIINN